MSTIGVDYSFSHPDPGAMKNDGVGLVIRYTTGPKALTLDEATVLRGLDIAIALVHETDAGRVNTGGTIGGIVDMQQVNAFAPTVGYPDDGTVFFADDTAPNLDGARAYFRGVRTQSGRHPIGWYGGWGVGLQLQAEGLVDILWVANAASWSGFRSWHDMAPVIRADSRVSMLQSLDHPLPNIAPSSYDYDEVLKPFPAWGVTLTPPAPPVAQPPREVGDVMQFHDTDGVRLDAQGCGHIAVNVPIAKVSSVQLFGMGAPEVERRYEHNPIARVVGAKQGIEVVITNGEPGGTYTVRVTSV